MRDMLEHFIRKIDEYIAIPSVITCEKPFVDHLQNDFCDLGCDIDRYGTLLSVSKGEGDYVLSAHIDRHGLIAEGNGIFTYAAGAHKQAISYKVWTERLKGYEKIAQRYIGKMVYAYDADTGEILQEGTVEDLHACEIRQNMTVRICNMAEIPARTPVAYSHRIEQDEEGLYDGQIDNVISAALIHTLYSYGYEGHAVFTPEEESGNSWKYLHSFLTHRDLLEKKVLVLDTSPFQDTNCVKAGNVVLRMRDEIGTFDKDLTQKIIDICDKLSVPYLLRDQQIVKENITRAERNESLRSLGKTELGHLYEKARPAIVGTTVQIPTFNYHENNETASHASLENIVKVLLRVTK